MKLKQIILLAVMIDLRAPAEKVEVMTAGMGMTMPSEAFGQKKQAARTAYVMNNMKLDAATKAKFEPVLAAYYTEMAAAKADYKKLKDKYDALRDTGKLSDAQCDQLFEGKLAQEKAELEVREKYYAKFKTVLSTKQAYLAIRLCNDKVE